MNIILVGFNDDTVTNVKETLKQIETVKKYKLDLADEEGNLLDWKQIDDYSNKKTMFQAILVDRKKRVNNRKIMADRPNFAAISIENDRIVRFEYYEGHDALELIYDIRSIDYKNKHMEPFILVDEFA